MQEEQIWYRYRTGDAEALSEIAEMAYLIFPRPFMVERGRHDTVQPDEWVAFEFAKVSHFYDQFGLKDKTDIEFFNGGHASRNEGVIQFLHKHLNWP